jgi:hypothetical protein
LRFARRNLLKRLIGAFLGFIGLGFARGVDEALGLLRVVWLWCEFA